jgi:hypothetical protein
MRTCPNTNSTCRVGEHERRGDSVRGGLDTRGRDEPYSGTGSGKMCPSIELPMPAISVLVNRSIFVWGKGTFSAFNLLTII